LDAAKPVRLQIKKTVKASKIMCGSTVNIMIASASTVNAQSVHGITEGNVNVRG